MNNQKMESDQANGQITANQSNQINLPEQTDQSNQWGRIDISKGPVWPNHGKPTEKNPNRLRNNLAIIASLIIILAGIHASKVILAPVFMSIFLSILLLPPLKWLRSSLKMSEGLSLTVVIFIVVGCGLSITTILASQLTDFARNLPTYRAKFDDLLHNYDLNLGNFIPMLKSDNEEEVPPPKDSAQAGKQYSATSPHSPSEKVPVSSKNNPPSESIKNGQASSINSVAPATGSQTPEVEKSTPSTKTVTSQVVKEASKSKTTETNTTETDNSETNTSAKESATETDSTKDYETANSSPEADSSNISGSNKAPGKIGKGIKIHAEALKPGGFFTNDEPAVKFDEIAHPSTMTGESAPPHEGNVPEGATPPHHHYQLPTVNITTEGAVKASSHELFQFLASLTSELSVFGSKVFIITLLTIFMLMEASNLPKKVDVSLGDRARQVAADIWHYMLIKSFVSLLVGLLVTVLLVVTEVRYPLLWGCLAFLLNYIPNIGSTVAAIPPLLLATVDYGLAVGMIAAIFFVIINCGVGYFLEPKLLGEGLDLSPIVVLLSLIFFGWLLGPIGMFLSPPLAVIGKIILKSFPETEWIAKVMANRPPEKKITDTKLETTEK